MKIIKVLLVVVVVIGIIGFIGFKKVNIEMDEVDLPANVYEEEGDLLNIVNTKLFDLFVLSADNEYTVVEEVINLVTLDTIRENVNAEYDPLSDCDTDECNYILQNEDYYINYAWAELSEDNQLIIHISVGSDKFIHINTIINFYLDIDINYLGFEISLTLDQLSVNEIGVSIDTLDKILGNFDKDNIEAKVTTGELDMEEYTYTLSFSILP